MIDFTPAIAQVTKQVRLNAIVIALEKNGIPYRIQQLDAPDALGNVIVTFNPDCTAKKTVVCAHYDNVPGTPGANDNAAACSILLNLILAAKAAGTKEHLEFVFFDLEESGFVGSRTYLHTNTGKLACVYNLDMCGMGSNTVVSLHNGARTMVAAHLDDVHEVRMLPPGDAYNFIYAGIPTVYVVNATDNDVAWFRAYSDGICSASPDFARTMHKPGDTPDTCNPAHEAVITEWLCQCLGI